MSKILKIDNGTVLIGNDDGSIVDVNINDCANFIPNVGDIVEVYFSDNKTIVYKNSKTIYKPLYPGQRVVNQVVYALLALFLGGLGFHKFYTGRIGLGILYLLFCWTGIPSLLGLIESIIAISKKSDDNGNIIV